MPDRAATLRLLYDGLSFISRQSRELGAQLHPELPLMAYSLLMFINSETDPRAVDVAAAYGLEKSTVSRQIGQLEAAGLVKRAGEQPGRRGHVLLLTDEGTSVLERSVASSQTTLASHMHDWNDQDLVALATLLSRFVETSRSARRSDDSVSETAP